MSNAYCAALKDFATQHNIQIENMCNHSEDFHNWLERRKQRGQYWGA